MTDNDSRYFLKTKRAGFRRWQPEDLPLAMELWGNPDVTRLFSKEPFTKEKVAARLNQEMENEKEHRIQYWPIFSLADDKHMGCAGLRPCSEDALELGFHFKPEFWGQGLATEVGMRVIEYAFEKRLTNALFAGHHPDNKPSRNALLKMGFLGIPGQYYEPTDIFHPSYMIYDKAPACTLRPATAGDAWALALVHARSIKATFGGLIDDYVEARSLDYCEKAWERRIANNECTTQVLARGKQIVGFAATAPSPDDDVKGNAGELDRIYLDPSVLGAGHGNTLIQWSEASIKSEGYSTIKLWVFEVNHRARQFYEKHGYKPDGRIKEEFNALLLRYEKGI